MAEEASVGHWLVKRNLSAESLVELAEEWRIDQSQVVAVTESTEGKFSMIFAPNDDQRALEAAEQERLAAVYRAALQVDIRGANRSLERESPWR